MTAFISRSLPTGSEFRRLLTAQGWEVTGQSLVLLSALPFAGLPPADWIFFSSQNAVRFFFQAVEQEGVDIPQVHWAAIGAATAGALKKYVSTVDFTGSGEPADTAATFRSVAADKRVVFPGARHSLQSVQRLLGEAVRGTHLEVYDNTPVADPAPRSEAVLVFTSPLNATAYLSRHPLRPGQHVVAIGQTTAAAIGGWSIESVTVAAAPTEAALAQAVLVI